MAGSWRRPRRRSTRRLAGTRSRYPPPPARALAPCWMQSSAGSGRTMRRPASPATSAPGRRCERGGVKLAITGGTGFVGARLLDAARNGGHAVRALTRRPMAPRPGIEWVAGDLAQAAALEALTEGADAVIHVAGAISGRTAADFAC